MPAFMPIANLRFEDEVWIVDTTGGGGITYTGVSDDASRKATFASTGASKRALQRYRVAIAPGATLRVTVPFARATEGSLWLGIDRKTGPGAMLLADVAEITGSEYGSYTVQVAADAMGFGEVVEIFLGARTNISGSGDMIGPVLFEQSGGVTIRRELACGLIAITGGAGVGNFTVAINSNFPAYGIASLTRIDAGNFDVELDFPIDELLTGAYDDGNYLRFYAALTTDGGNLKYNFGGHNWMDSDGSPKRNAFRVRAWDTTADAYEDFDAMSGTIYVYASVFM